jgi:hypothetical protein
VQEPQAEATKKGLKVPVDYNEPTKDTKMELYLHGAVPQHSPDEVRKGVFVATFDVAKGQGTKTAEVTWEQLDQLGLRPGDKLHFAAVWPEYRHAWGTAMGTRNEGTSLTIPDGTKRPGKAAAEQETFPDGMPLQWHRPLWNGARAGSAGKGGSEGAEADPLARPADIASLPREVRNFTKAGSLLESEAKLSVGGLEQLNRALELLREMAKDPRNAEAVLGQGWSVVETAAYTFVDEYRDSRDLKLAREEGGLRVREVKGSGQPKQMNYKDPGGIRGGPREVVISRTERFTDLGRSPDLPSVARSDSIVNPLRGVKQEGRDPAELLEPAATITQHRTRFQLNFAEPGKGPQAVAEISVDDVHDFVAHLGQGARQPTRFYGIEVDIAHLPVDGTGKPVDFIPEVKNWRPPHRARDIPAVQRDPSIQRTYQAIGRLAEHMTKQGIHVQPGVPKYTEGMIRTRAFTPRGQFQQDVLRRQQREASQAASSSRVPGGPNGPRRTRRAR